MPTYLSRTATTSPCVPQHSPMSSFHEIPDDLSVNRRTSSASCDIDISVCVCVCVRACVCVRCSAVCQLLQLVSFPHTKRKSARHTRPRAQSHASCNRAATELRIVRGAPDAVRLPRLDCSASCLTYFQCILWFNSTSIMLPRSIGSFYILCDSVRVYVCVCVCVCCVCVCERESVCVCLCVYSRARG